MIRNRLQKNEIINKGDISLIVLYGKEKKGKGQTPYSFAIIDTADVYKIKDTKWGKNKLNYVSNQRIGYLHHLILKKEGKKVIDHINFNTLDNRKSNLRSISHSANLLNNRSKGYHFSKTKKRYIVQIMHHYKSNFGGSFKYEIDAKNKANKLRKELFNKELGL